MDTGDKLKPEPARMRIAAALLLLASLTCAQEGAWDPRAPRRWKVGESFRIELRDRFAFKLQTEGARERGEGELLEAELRLEVAAITSSGLIERAKLTFVRLSGGEPLAERPLANGAAVDIEHTREDEYGLIDKPFPSQLAEPPGPRMPSEAHSAKAELAHWLSGALEAGIFPPAASGEWEPDPVLALRAFVPGSPLTRCKPGPRALRGKLTREGGEVRVSIEGALTLAELPGAAGGKVENAGDSRLAVTASWRDQAGAGPIRGGTVSCELLIVGEADARRPDGAVKRVKTRFERSLSITITPLK